MKRVLSFLLIIITLAVAANAYAEQTHTYNVANLPQKSTYQGMSLKGTLPALNPNWTSGTENKINYEFWFNINNDSNSWVEMGYHNGYAWNSDGSVNKNASYNGLFTAKATAGGGWTVSAVPQAGWDAGQTHTMSNVLKKSSTDNTWYSEMIADDTVYVTYSDAQPSTGTINAGLEWGVSNGASQSISFPSSMTELKVNEGGVWKTWSSIGGVSTSNNHGGVTASYDSTQNSIQLQNDMSK